MWVLGLVILIDEIDKNIVRGMITPIKEEFGVGDLGISVLLSLALLFNGLITVPAGYLADRWNRTRAIGQTVVGWSAITALGATALNFPMLVGLRSALGFGQAITEPSAASLLGDHYPPEQRGKAFSIQQVMLLAGTGLGVALGGGLAAAFNWRVGLLVAGAPWAVRRLPGVPAEGAQARHRRPHGRHRRREASSTRRTATTRSCSTRASPSSCGTWCRASART